MKVHELLADAAAWVKKVMAVDNTGTRVEPWSPTACAWCPNGAIDKIYGDTPAAEQARMMVAQILEPNKKSHELQYIGGIYIAQWNDRDERTHEEVLSLLRKADI